MRKMMCGMFPFVSSIYFFGLSISLTHSLALFSTHTHSYGDGRGPIHHSETAVCYGEASAELWGTSARGGGAVAKVIEKMSKHSRWWQCFRMPLLLLPAPPGCGVGVVWFRNICFYAPFCPTSIWGSRKVSPCVIASHFLPAPLCSSILPATPAPKEWLGGDTHSCPLHRIKVME